MGQHNPIDLHGMGHTHVAIRTS